MSITTFSALSGDASSGSITIGRIGRRRTADWLSGFKEPGNGLPRRTRFRSSNSDHARAICARTAGVVSGDSASRIRSDCKRTACESEPLRPRRNCFAALWVEGQGTLFDMLDTLTGTREVGKQAIIPRLRRTDRSRIACPLSRAHQNATPQLRIRSRTRFKP